MNEFDTMKIAKNENDRDKNVILSHFFRSKRRTYFFDLKRSKDNEPYLILTESKRRFDEATNAFFYEKYKIFLQREDIEGFYHELRKIVDFLAANQQWDTAADTKNINLSDKTN
jgi:hypothetical protein